MSEPVKQLSISLMDIKKPNGVLHYRHLVDGADITDKAKIELVIEALGHAMGGMRVDLNETSNREIVEVDYEES